jgi:hypothetical protein
LRYCVIVCEDPDDRFTAKIGADDEPAEREPWQRANTLLAIGPEINRAPVVGR